MATSQFNIIHNYTGAKMKHSELIKELDNLEPENAQEFLEGLVDIVMKNLLLGNTINIKNMGRFRIKDRKASKAFLFTGRNKGKVTKVKPTKTVTFKVSENLRNKIREQYGTHN